MGHRESGFAGFSPVQPTPLKDLEAILHRLDSKKAEWANLSTLKRADILRRTLKCVIQVQTSTYAVSCKHSRDGKSRRAVPSLPISRRP